MARWYQASSSDEAGDDEEWEEELNLKLEQLRSLLRSLDPLHGAVHPEDEHVAERARPHRGDAPARHGRPHVRVEGWHVLHVTCAVRHVQRAALSSTRA